ncbi:polysaccharide deacetylase family protein [Asticcacaulis solisilvae]|uniref:polysaccharide deacetylase family protein n=1 Tax=Asticcacaulis solisilvae TaxID=1217274 RepID=UPI003FD730E0
MHKHVFLAALLLAPPLSARAGDTVALTFDDLPGLTLHNSQPYVNDANARLLDGLKRHGFPAIGFVNEGKIADMDRTQQTALLEDWVAAGFDLGNHTYSHESPNKLSARAYTADILKGERVIRPLLESHGKTLTWFRYPYLETGPTKKKKTDIEAWLKDHNYRIAPVTMENSDWMFSEPYDDAVTRKNARRVAKIRAEYLAYTDRTLTLYQKAGRALFGRDMAYVMLLHDTRLNADCIDDLADILKRHDLGVVTLEQAMADPAYQTPDTYVGKDGLEWLERWSRGLNKDLPWDDFKDPPKDIQTAYTRLDTDR